MRWRSWILIAAVGVGCAHASPPSNTTAPVVRSDARVEALEAEARRRADEIRELESQLALARARASVRQETVRIGGEPREPSREADLVYFDGEGTAWDEPPASVLDDGDAAGAGDAESGDNEAGDAETANSGPRPVLRLHEEPRYDPFSLPTGVAPLSPLPPSPPVAALPAAVAATGWRAAGPRSVSGPAALPVDSVSTVGAASTEGSASAVGAAPVSLAAVPVGLPAPRPGVRAPRVDTAEQAYAGALGLLRERRVHDALRAFEAFLAGYGGSPKAVSARYWRAEALYVLRRYGEAQAAFDAYLVAHPRDVRAPDALLKLGLCHEHMGDRGAALRTFERLRREFPTSVAARLASREDA